MTNTKTFAIAIIALCLLTPLAHAESEDDDDNERDDDRHEDSWDLRDDFDRSEPTPARAVRKVSTAQPVAEPATQEISEADTAPQTIIDESSALEPIMQNNTTTDQTLVWQYSNENTTNSTEENTIRVTEPTTRESSSWLKQLFTWFGFIRSTS